jgi:hypothetical protein
MKEIAHEPTTRKVLEAGRASALATLAAFDAALAALDSEHGADELITLRDGWPTQVNDSGKLELAPGGVAGETLCRWARMSPPRLRAFEAERGRLVAWSSDIRRAIEARLVKSRAPASTAPANDDHDPFAADLAAGRLRAVR